MFSDESESVRMRHFLSASTLWMESSMVRRHRKIVANSAENIDVDLRRRMEYSFAPITYAQATLLWVFEASMKQWIRNN